MRILIEEYQYDVVKVKDVLYGIDALENVEGKVSIHYVGYFYNTLLKDCVFILPKVLLKDVGGQELAFGKYKPEDIVSPDKNWEMEVQEKDFLLPLSLFDLFHDPEATPVSQAPPRGHGDGCYSTRTVRTLVLGSLLSLAQSPVSSLQVAGRENARTSLSLTFRYLKESNVLCFRGVLSVSQGSRARRGYMGQGTGCRVCVCPSRTFQPSLHCPLTGLAHPET